MAAERLVSRRDLPVLCATGQAATRVTEEVDVDNDAFGAGGFATEVEVDVDVDVDGGAEAKYHLKSFFIMTAVLISFWSQSTSKIMATKWIDPEKID